ncbi:chemotaxis protein MotB [Corallococcus praedator]|uniref:Chemotaxis protein MotB n=1 Tax=Corallococcus praedator TaxID=2316724 RepID=A0ABX9QQ62_9BACT|nr:MULTISPECIES: flagellar motor protein MotB [Corallococcus]RKH14990.1 chemotaxis protein MotB [Corallococcus sp. CA047B]RKH33397.1 chemotaxis protein MotB [Corallococcus sp. CA031C]RKI14521.1 chemotaxis protein MotB [Corallococcus praedator]
METERGRAWVPWLVTALVAVLAGTVLYLSHRSSTLADAAATAAATRASDAEAAKQLLETKLAALEAEREKLTTEKDQLNTEKAQLSQTVQEQEAELARLKATYEDLQDKMKKEIAEGAVRLTQNEGRIQVDLVDKVLFDSGDASISARGQEVLTRLGGVLSKVDDKRIQVSGHTDDSPPSQKLQATFPTNWELSVARAVNVVRFLQDKGGVPAKRMLAAGYGDTRPLGANASPQGRARNRRIELLLIPELSARRNPAIAKAAPAKAAPAKATPAKPVLVKKVRANK